jgi:hypothetical protein
VTGSGRQPIRALLALAAAGALVLSAAVLPLFGAAAPAGGVAEEIGDLAAGERADGSGSASGPGSGGGGGSGSGGSGGSGGGGGGSSGGSDLGDFGLGQSGLLSGDTPSSIFDSLASGGASGGGGSGGSSSGGAGGGGSGGGSGGAGGGTADPSGSSGGGDGGLVEAFARLFGGGGGESDGSDTRAPDESGSPSDPVKAIERAGGQCLDSSPYVVCFPSAPVPGEETRVLVLRDGEPVPDVVVTFNGDPVGRTDDRGVVTASAPYVRQLSVGVRAPAESVPPAALAGSADLRYSLAQPDDGNVSVPVEGELAIAVGGDPGPGETVPVRVTLGDRPVPNATVRVDGDHVGRTDTDGHLGVALPMAESTTVRAERGEFDAERTLTLATIDISLATGPLPVGIPGQPATLNVTDDGAPVANATVAVGGSTVGRTAPDGTVAASLPLAPTVDVTVTTAAELTVTRSRAVFVAPLVALLGLLALAGGLGYLYRQSEATGRGLLEQLRTTLSNLAADLLSALVGLASGVEGTLAELRERIRAAIAAVSAPDVDLRECVRGRLTALRVALLGLLVAPVERVRRLGERVAGGNGGAAAAGGTSEPTAPGPRERIERTWGRFVRRVGIRGPRTTTPGEVAGRGVSKGLPAEPVRRLTDAFRSVAYSDADPARHVDDVAQAAAELGLDGADRPDEAADGGASAASDGSDADTSSAEGGAER